MTNSNFTVSETILSAFFKKLSLNKRSLLITDYDGTLSPFHLKRHLAFPYTGMYERLRMINYPPSRVVIVTGRNLKELVSMLNWPLFPEIWGSYGLERLTCSGEYQTEKLDLNEVRGLKLAQELHPEFVKDGTFEVKPFSLALHWRGLSEHLKMLLLNKIYKEWEEITYDYHLEILNFDGGIELKPKGINKGEVIKKILKNTSPDMCIAYMGDDLSDEEAFEALGNRGLKILVKDKDRPHTKADVRINPGPEVVGFLDRWIKNIQEDHAT